MTSNIKELSRKPRLSREQCLGAIKPAALTRWRELIEVEAKTKQSAALPLPGASKGAFPAISHKVLTFTVRPMKAADWAILQKLNSPLIEQAVEMTKPEKDRKEIKVEWLEIITCVYLMTRPCEETYLLLSEVGGDKKIRVNALKDIGKLDMEAVSRMFELCQGQMEVAFSTTLQYAGDSTGGEQRFFPASSPSTTETAGLLT